MFSAAWGIALADVPEQVARKVDNPAPVNGMTWLPPKAPDLDPILRQLLLAGRGVIVQVRIS